MYEKYHRRNLMEYNRHHYAQMVNIRARNKKPLPLNGQWTDNRQSSEPAASPHKDSGA
jgi:hypothetical protein